MKEKLKNKKGITLIALVITIIVLLILAIVTIRIMTNQNIIGHANNAVTAYNEAQQNETAQLTWVEGLMKNKGGSSSSTTNITGITARELTEQEIQELIASGVADSREELIDKDDAKIAETNEGYANDTTIGLLKMDGDIIIRALFFEKDNETSYIYFTDMTMPSELSDSSSIKLNTWYKMGEDSVLEEYTGPALFNGSEFKNVYSPTLLNEVLATFNS